MRQKRLMWVWCLVPGLGLLPFSTMHAQDAQAPVASSPSAAPARVVGSLVKVEGHTLTIKDQKGLDTTITLTDATKLLQIAPGQTSLANATPTQLTDMQPGDRLLVRVQTAPDGGMTATTVVAMRQTDIAQQHAAEAAAWQHGVGGLVKQVNAAEATIVITSSVAATGGHSREVTIKLGPKAAVKRYASSSVQFALAQPSTLDKVMVGDQLRARGVPGASPAEFNADEVVAGSFRNLSGKITAVDTGSGMVSLTDLATKQPVQLKVTDDSQLRKLDDPTAERLAAAMKTTAGAPAGGPPAGAMPGGVPMASGHSGPPPSAAHHVGPEGTPVAGAGPGAGADMQQALAHAAVIHLADVKKGDLVMVVASSGADSQYGAVTLVTGVEPLLRASPNASAAGLSSWSLGAGGAGGGEQQ